MVVPIWLLIVFGVIFAVLLYCFVGFAFLLSALDQTFRAVFGDLYKQHKTKPEEKIKNRLIKW